MLRYILFIFIALVVLRIGETTSRLAFPDVSPKEFIESAKVEVENYYENNYISSISIDYLRQLDLIGSDLVIEEELSPGSNYSRYIASYMSEGNMIYGLLTVPNEEMPENGFSAVVFNHGYIPPSQYKTTEKYVAYVDYLASNGFVVFKIDLRGHGNSEGEPRGTYFSADYTIDAINALRSLQRFEKVNPEKIGMWGHSMAGNLVLRAMLVEKEIAAASIWAGAVYSYKDFVAYRLNDSSYVRRPQPAQEIQPVSTGSEDDQEESRPLTAIEKSRQAISDEVQKLRTSSEDIDFNDPFWESVSLTRNIDYLENPIQLHHAIDDPTVNIGYSYDLVKVLESSGKAYEFYEYPGGGHNINSPYFEEAMQRTVEFFEKHL